MRYMYVYVITAASEIYIRRDSSWKFYAQLI